MGPLAVGASLVGLGWPTVTKVVMAIITQDVIKIANTLCKTEGRLKYSLCQVPSCVNVCHFHLILL